MNLLVTFSQIIIAISIIFVWVFRYENIVKEFKQYGLPDIIRNLVGATKISLATLLVAGIWHSNLVVFPAFIMAFLMLCALYAHLRVKNPLKKYLPSFFLLCLSLFIGFSMIDFL
tara:strand:+ start:79 stop:423 length:345 start_codon:yes stop_codon:yes gene_type:complete